MLGAKLPVDFLAIRWEVWLVVGSGLSLIVLALVGVRRVRAATPPAVAASEPPAAPEPAYDPFLQGSPSEQRTSARRKGGVVEVLLSDAAVKAPPFHGHVLDRSLGGMRLATKTRVRVGTVLTIRTVDAPEGVPWVEVEVRSCREAADSWELGVRYVRTPPMGVLLLFH